jgi:hypothetical protein
VIGPAQNSLFAPTASSQARPSMLLFIYYTFYIYLL